MRAIRGILVLTTLLVVYSCKNDEDFNSPVKYVFSDIIYGDVKTYTNSGDRNDSNKIYSFLENYRGAQNMAGGSGYILVKGSMLNILEEQATNIPFKINDEIEFISKTKAKVTSNDTVIYFDLIRKNGVLYFQSLDTLSNHIDINDLDKRPYYMKPFYLWDSELKYIPIQIDTITCEGVYGSFSKLYYKPCIYATETKDEIQITYTCYVESNYIPIYMSKEVVPAGYYYEHYIRAVQNIQNDFNQDYLQRFQSCDTLRKDTIVYKINKVIFKKK